MKLRQWRVVFSLTDDTSPFDGTEECAESQDGVLRLEFCFHGVHADWMTLFVVGLLGKKSSESAVSVKDDRMGFVVPVNLRLVESALASHDSLNVHEGRKLLNPNSLWS